MTRLLLVLVVLLCGCATPPSGQRLSDLFTGALAGSSDLELTYEMVAGGSRDAIREELRALVIQRLAATQIGADVHDIPEAESQRNPRIAVIVDEAYASYVDEIMTWTGSLDLFADDPTYLVVPPSRVSPDLVQGPDGAYEGTRNDVVRALDGWHVDAGHRLLAEPMWATATPTTPARWRLRIVLAEHLDELGEGALIGWSSGSDLRVRGAAGSAAAAVVARARTRPPAVVARGRISLGTTAFDADGMLLSFGSGAEAYARAQRERRLLASARLPVMKRVDALGLPPNHTLELACLIVPILLSFAWLLFVRRFDRAHPEPMWLIAVTFLLGALSVVPAGLLEVLFASLSPWLDPGLVTFGGQSFAFPLAFVVFTVVVGLSEEGSKYLAAQFAVRRPEFDEPVDGIVYGIVASLGFAAAENIRYFAVGRMNAPLVIARCFMSVPAHMFFGALWGYALGAKLVNPGKRRWAWLLFAAAMHGLFDAFLSTDGAGLLAVVLNVGLASVFVVLVRRSLRHGIVTKEMLSIRHEDRTLFRVGRPGLFFVSAFFLHAFAFGVFILGAYYQISRHRPTVGFVVGSSVLLALLAVSALGISMTLPLDIAIDAYGVTFAGAARPWRKIRGYTRTWDHVELDCEGGAISLGPAPARTLDAVVETLKLRLGGDGAARADTLESRRN